MERNDVTVTLCNHSTACRYAYLSICMLHTCQHDLKQVDKEFWRNAASPPHLSPTRRVSPFWSLAFAVTRCSCGQVCSPVLLCRLLLIRPNIFQWGNNPTHCTFLWRDPPPLDTRLCQQTDRPHHICSKRPHLCTLCMRCGLKIKFTEGVDIARYTTAEVEIRKCREMTHLSLLWFYSQSRNIWACPATVHHPSSKRRW